jgi:hypothetical protein
LNAARVAMNYAMFDRDKVRDERWIARLRAWTGAMIASTETCSIESIDRWHQLQWCSQEQMIKAINSNEDCQREPKRNNNQLACDCCLVAFCGQVARMSALAIHNSVCQVLMDSAFNWLV